VGWGASGLSICHADEGTLQTRQQPDSTHQSSNINSNSITKDQQGVVWRVAVAATAWGPGGKPRRMGSAWGRHGVSMGLAWGWHGVSMGLAYFRMGPAPPKTPQKQKPAGGRRAHWSGSVYVMRFQMIESGVVLKCRPLKWVTFPTRSIVMCSLQLVHHCCILIWHAQQRSHERIHWLPN
jgi:hypothetical protein